MAKRGDKRVFGRIHDDHKAVARFLDGVAYIDFDREEPRNEFA